MKAQGFLKIKVKKQLLYWFVFLKEGLLKAHIHRIGQNHPMISGRFGDILLEEWSRNVFREYQYQSNIEKTLNLIYKILLIFLNAFLARFYKYGALFLEVYHHFLLYFQYFMRPNLQLPNSSYLTSEQSRFSWKFPDWWNGVKYSDGKSTPSPSNNFRDSVDIFSSFRSTKTVSYNILYCVMIW